MFTPAHTHTEWPCSCTHCPPPPPTYSCVTCLPLKSVCGQHGVHTWWPQRRMHSPTRCWAVGQMEQRRAHTWRWGRTSWQRLRVQVCVRVCTFVPPGTAKDADRLPADVCLYLQTHPPTYKQHTKRVLCVQLWWRVPTTVRGSTCSRCSKAHRTQ